MLLRSIFLAVFALVVQPASTDNSHCAVNLDFTKRYLASEESVRLCDAYPDTVLLLVNTASYCGFTSQFAGLEALQENMATGFFRARVPFQRFLPGSPLGEKDSGILRPHLPGEIPDVRKIPGRQA